MSETIKDLHKLIIANYRFDDIVVDHYGDLHFNYKELRIQIGNKNPYGTKGRYIFIQGEIDGVYVRDESICEDNLTTVYYLLKYCKDAHVWGEFTEN